jgi:CheY-like chemotaxis protein
MNDVHCGSTVLLITPFADERQMYELSLRHAGFDVLVSAPTHAAIRLAAERGVAAVVLRIRQEGDCNGIELTSQLKMNPRTRHIPVVVISTFVQPDVRSAAFAAGCDQFLLLPCLPDVLASELRALIRRSSGSEHATPS